MEYEKIQKENDRLEPVELNGKGYITVNQRIQAFRRTFPEGRIETEILKFSDHSVLVKASVYDGTVLLGTGHAFEEKTLTGINSTSFVECAESSAVGRAIGIACGLGIKTAICTYDEVASATAKQNAATNTPPKNPNNKYKNGKLFIPKDDVSQDLYERTQELGMDWDDIRKWAVANNLTFRNLNDDIVREAIRLVEDGYEI